MTAPEADGSFEALLDFLYRTHGFDFTGYKRSSLMRRVRRRLQLVGIDSFADYHAHLEAHPEEFNALFDGLLINVTGFFRDPASWDFLHERVVPRIIENHSDGDPIRVWSAGCASGEEAYTVAMIFAESMGLPAFRERVKVYATDVDEDALACARAGTYTMRDVSHVPDALREQYFQVNGTRVTFNPELRRSVIFGRHDLVHHAPISRLDLLVCRNTLMYFTADMQSRILGRLHYALNDNGYLFLGHAEMLLSHAWLFAPFDRKHRVFVKVPRPALRGRAPVPLGGGEVMPDSAFSSGWHVRLHDLADDVRPVAEVLVSAEGLAVSANEHARRLLSLGAQDIGKRLQDLDLPVRPADLRSAIEAAHASSQPVVIDDAQRPGADGQTQYLAISVIPIVDADSTRLGTSVVFTDISAAKNLEAELVRSRQELESAYEELQSSTEELETTNEELQSTVEELETTNEELQSANEELETMNEELQSTNAELQSINTELGDRSLELDRVNAFTDSVLASLRLAMVVVDGDLRVRIWNDRAQDLWGLRADEVVGASILQLDSGLPVTELRNSIVACLRGDSIYTDETVPVINRRGRNVTCRIVCTPLSEPVAEVPQGVVILMEESGA